jgi:catechol 2,3-dioxygenase-like lactoylglutathione lyase family enzyme
MIGYVTLGTNDLPRAVAFYDKRLATLGAERLDETDRDVAHGTDEQSPGLGITKPFDGNPAVRGNRTTVGLQTDRKDKVDAVYKLALELGGTDEGTPGPRGDGF